MVLFIVYQQNTLRLVPKIFFYPQKIPDGAELKQRGIVFININYSHFKNMYLLLYIFVGLKMVWYLPYLYL